MSLYLTIVTPTLSRCLQVHFIEVETAVGNFVIQPGHAPMLLMIDFKKKVTFQIAHHEKTMETFDMPLGGIFEVNRDRATLIVHE